jgi:PAS domain S-box-containing protein
MVGTIHDVTEARAADAKLRQTKENLERAQRIAHMGSLVRDLATDEIECSDEVYRIFGVDPATFDTATSSFDRLLVPEDRGKLVVARDRIMEGICPEPFEYRIQRPDGSVRHVYRETEIIRDEAGKPVKFVGTLHDVTEARAAEQRQRELQTQLQHSQKLEALGTLAGGVAHELNNALMPICALSKMMLETLRPESEDREDLEMIVIAGDRARNLVQQILSFSRKQDFLTQDAPRKQVDLADLLRRSLQLLRLTVPATVRLSEEISPVPLVLADADKLHQVVINLVTNAAQAIGWAIGTVTIGIAPAGGPENGVSDSAGGGVRLWIADTGCGMDARTVERIFEPFFTTKEVGEGTGLGLSVVHGIISDHGGRVEVESEPGKGTKFTIHLPTSAAAAVPMLAA